MLMLGKKARLNTEVNLRFKANLPSKNIETYLGWCHM